MTPCGQEERLVIVNENRAVLKICPCVAELCTRDELPSLNDDLADGRLRKAGGARVRAEGGG